jgi:predicted ATPase
MVLCHDIEKYQQHENQAGLVFYDRSVIEALCMLDQVEPLQEYELTELLSVYQYHRQVFVLPPWEAIYTNDMARDQSFVEAVRVHEAATRWYRRCLYEVIEVPRLTVAERCGYVLSMLAATDA